MKKVLIVTGVALMAFAAVAAAQSATFNTNLTVGSTGADVVALQTWLMANGYSIPALSAGTAKGYFGTQTKAAVMAYQAKVGVPNTGFVGPMTRAKLNGGVSAPVAAGFTCPAGYKCTANSGTTPVVSGVATEGLFTVKQAAQPANNTNVTSNSNVPVYGVDVKAQNSDMVIDRADLEFAVTVNSNTVNPSGFVNSISAWDGSTLLKTMPLSSADFTKDTNGLFYVRVVGINFRVPVGQTKTLTFTVNTSSVSSADYTRTLTVKGYSGSTQNIRGVDGLGLSTYANNNWTSTFTFQASNNSTLTATANTATPGAQTIAVNTTDGVRGVTMETFDLKSTTGDSQLDSLRVYVKTDSGTYSAPTALYLYDGSTILGSGSVTVTNGSGYVDFTSLTVKILKDQIKTLTIKADFPSTAVGVASTTIRTSAAETNTTMYETADATTKEVTIASEIVGNDVHLYATAAPAWTLVSSSIVSSAGVVDVASSSITGTIVLSVKANGGSMTKPVAGDFSVVFASSTSATSNTTSYTSANSISVTPSVTVSPSTATVGDGSTYTVTITGTLYSSNSNFGATVGNGYAEFMAVKDIDSVTGTNTITNQAWGLDTFYTPTATLTKGTK
jgi:peptidoglycan hydrolase-like protein with peptidoglycan-binding domain